MLHYRLFVEVDDPHEGVEKRAREQLYSWVRSQRLDADELTLGREVELGPRAIGSLAESIRGNGDRSLRAVITQTNTKGEWTTQLTVHTPANMRAKPWLWLDLTGPDNIIGKPPRLARDLLKVFDATTGAVRQGEAQVVQDIEGVRELVEALCDPARRTLVFVAGSDPRFPFPDWIGHVRTLLRDTVGMAGGYVLTPVATNQFNNAFGPLHEVSPWTVRTFRPGVEPDNADDGRRHKVLSLDRIIADSTRRLARLLGRRAWEAALETPLPPIAIRVDRAFAKLINADLVASLDAPAADTRELGKLARLAVIPVEPHPSAEHDLATPDIKPPSRNRDEGTDTPAEEPPARPAHHDHIAPDAVPPDVGLVAAGAEVSAGTDVVLLQAVELVLGGGPLTVERIREWGDFAERGRRAASNRNAIDSRLKAYEERVATLEAEQQELRRRLEDSQLDTAAAEDERARAATELRRLQKLLLTTNQVEQIWVTGEAEKAIQERPQDCEDLARKLDHWQHVTFTGNVDGLFELDKYDPTGAWAGKTWDILGALDDYARTVIDGTFAGSVHDYLLNPPPGCRTFSAARHAADESTHVRENSKHAAQRTFPVPTTVDPAGKIFMGAHFKIAQSGTISPRLYYCNDVRSTRRIYVGYIGRHLRNSQTN